MRPTQTALDGCLRAAGRRLLAATGGGPTGPAGRAKPTEPTGRAELTGRAEPLGDAPLGTGLQVLGAHGSATSSVHGWRVERDGPYDEVCAQAAFGLMAVHGRAAGDVAPIGVPYVCATVASMALQGALAVVVGRLRGLAVEHAAVSLPAAAALTVSQYLAAATATEDPEVGQPQQPRGTARPPFRSADGVRLELEALDAAPWQAFWTRLGADATAISRSWRPFLLRYPSATAALSPQLHQALAGWAFADLAGVAARTGMSLCPVRSVAQRRRDPDVLATAGLPAPWRLITSLAAAVADSGAGSAGSGAGSAGSGELPLAGVRVVESCRRVQGPLAGRLLVLLGAEVVRVEPPGGDPLRGMLPMAGDCSARFVALNHGKQVVEVDIRTPAGQAEIRELVRDADVFVQNWAPGAAQRYRLDAEDLQRIRPELVYARASAWGDTSAGPSGDPWGGAAPPLGTDFMVQAHSGLAEVLGEPGAPRPSLMTLLDLFGAQVCIEGVLTGLALRYLDGRGRRVESSLLGAADVLLAEALGPDALGPDAGCTQLIAGVFDTADEPLALAARSATSIDALCRAVGIAAPTHPQETAELRAQLEPPLRTRPARCWLERLHTAGVPAAVARTDLTALPADPRLAEHIAHHGCAVVTSPWRFS